MTIIKGRMLLKTTRLVFTVLVCIELVGCGGGGSSAAVGPVVSSLEFPLKSAYSELTASGFTRNFTISGTCAGSASITGSTASAGAIFEGLAALSAVRTLTANFTNCTPASSAASSTQYYDANYAPLGFSSSTEYGVFASPPAIPKSVSVGSTGTLGFEAVYTDSSKTVRSGRAEFSYVVEADTSSTAIVNLIIQRYDTSNALLYTEQQRYRIGISGPLTPVSIDDQFATTSTRHLVLQ